MPRKWQTAMNLAAARRHTSLGLIFFFYLSPSTPPTFKKFISESENGTPCAISICEQERAVLRITITEELTEQRWMLQGRLSGPWVAQLKSNWDRSRCPNGSRKC